MGVDGLADWCQHWLGSMPVEVMFENHHLSVVTGLRLEDGQKVVVKVRPPSTRIAGCAEVHRRLWESGFPCPQPLIGPVPFGALAATAEAFAPGGTDLDAGDDRPELFARLLADLVSRAPAPDDVPSLDPAPPWIWCARSGRGIWPPADDRDADLNSQAKPTWLTRLVQRVHTRLERVHEASVVGHSDWWQANVRWNGRMPHVVHDWDSVVARPEVIVAGAASAVFRTTGHGDMPTTAESEAFLAGYAAARRARWTRDDWEACWAAGLWSLAFDAKKESLDGETGPLLEHLAAEAEERLRRADA